MLDVRPCLLVAMLAVPLLLGSSCARTIAPATRPAEPSPASDDPPPPKVRRSVPLLAVAAEARVSIYQPLVRSLKKLGSWTLDAQVDTLAWVDARRVAVLVTSGRVSLLAVGQKAQPLVAPAAKSWAVPRPEDGDDLLPTTFPLGRMRLIAGIEGGLWLGHCAWYARGEGDPCFTWRYQRLLPSPKVSRYTPTARPAQRPERTSAGLNLSVEVHNYGKSPNSVACTWAGKTQTKLFANQPCPTQVATRWMAPHSRWLLLHLTKDCGGADYVHERLLVHDCKLGGLRRLETLHYGPDYLWAHDAARAPKSGFYVLRRDERLGWLWGHVLRFSPVQ